MGRLSRSSCGRVASSLLLAITISSCTDGSHSSPAGNDVSQNQAPVQQRSADAILDRNPFDSATGPLIDTGYTYEATASCPNIEVRRVVLSPSPPWSFAEVEDGAAPRLLHRGSPFGTRHVVSIAENGVLMSGPSGTCWAEIGGKTRVYSPACIASKFAIGPLCIDRRRDGSIDVASAMVDHALEQMFGLMRSTRLVPERDASGKTIGIRIFGIRKESLLDALGFENGDVLHTVNDIDITAPDRALQAYAGLRHVTEIRVGLKRRGEDRTVVIHIR